MVEKVAFRFPELYTNFWQQKEDIVSLMPRSYSICFRYACNAINTESKLRSDLIVKTKDVS